MRRALAICTLPTLAGCSVWFFTGNHWVDRTRPVALVETTGGIELGAATEFGVLTLGRTAESGPCRVHYFVGPTPIVESGTLVATDSVFTRADIDLKTQSVRALDRSLRPGDALVAMWTADGTRVTRVSVELARGAGIDGDLLCDPGVELPAGAVVLCRSRDDRQLFAGLIAGRAVVGGGPAAGRYYVIAGVDRVRELLAVPRHHPTDEMPRYRADNIIVDRPVAEPEMPQPAGEPPVIVFPPR